MCYEKIYRLYLKGNKDALFVLEDNYRYQLTQYVLCYLKDKEVANEVVNKVFYRLSIFHFNKLEKNFCAYMN